MFARKPLAESPRVVKQLLSGNSPFRRGNIWDKNDAVRIYFSFFGPPCYGRTILVNPLFTGLVFFEPSRVNNEFILIFISYL
jgi:hypothetical protein